MDQNGHEAPKRKRFFILIEENIEEGKPTYRVYIRDEKIQKSQVLLIIETWLRKNKKEEMQNIRDSFPF